MYYDAKQDIKSKNPNPKNLHPTHNPQNLNLKP
jgi:hypothetical protein